MDDDAYDDMLELAKNHREALRKQRPKAPPSEDAWPCDQSDWTFLGRAIQQLGARRFGIAWTGREGKPFSRFPLPNFSDSKSPRFLEARRHAHRMLVSHPEYVACPIEPAEHRGPDFAFSGAIWSIAQTKRRESIREGIAGLARRRSVLDELRQALHQETIRAGYRGLLDEEVEKLPLEIWRHIDFGTAADHFQIDLTVVTSRKVHGGFRWLYVSTDDLRNVCELQAGQPQREPAEPTSEGIVSARRSLSSEAGKRSGQIRREASERWKAAALESALSISTSVNVEDLAAKAIERLRAPGKPRLDIPSLGTVTAFLRKMRREGRLPAQKP